MKSFDPVQRHVECPRGTGSREPVSINDIGLTADLRRLAELRECGAMFGVNGATVTVKQSCPPQEPCTIPQSGQTDTQIRCSPEQGDKSIISLEFCPVAAANDQ